MAPKVSAKSTKTTKSSNKKVQGKKSKGGAQTDKDNGSTLEEQVSSIRMMEKKVKEGKLHHNKIVVLLNTMVSCCNYIYLCQILGIDSDLD